MRYSTSKDTNKKRLSAVIQEIAGELIRFGKDIEDRKNYLGLACTGWNIACLPLSSREFEIKRVIETYRVVNKATLEDLNISEENIRLVIAQKDKLYPNFNAHIINSDMKIINGVESILINSIQH